jgi:hypothetical protein
MKSRYMVVEVTDLRTREKSYKVYERNARTPLTIGIATREEAEAKVRELEEAEAR